jgi:energy-coupling factor transporter ATP-binding protein EcfA2
MSEKEAQDLAQENLPEILFSKLKNPKTILSIDQQIECLTACVSLGSMRARKIKEGRIVFVIGNTGAGKSTLVNFVHGCTMERFSNKNSTFAFRVHEGSRKPELMPIDHNNTSTTFIPGIEGDANFTYVECPGVLDNRGNEVNIANTVNIRQVIHASKNGIVVVLLNYYTLKADRGKGLRDLATILEDLFGTVECIAEHAASIALGLSRVPISEDEEKNSLPMVQSLLEDVSSLKPSQAKVVEA